MCAIAVAGLRAASANRMLDGLSAAKPVVRRRGLMMGLATAQPILRTVARAREGTSHSRATDASIFFAVVDFLGGLFFDLLIAGVSFLFSRSHALNKLFFIERVFSAVVYLFTRTRVAFGKG